MEGQRDRRKCWYVSLYGAHLQTDRQTFNSFEEYLSFSVLQNSECSAIDCRAIDCSVIDCRAIDCRAPHINNLNCSPLVYILRLGQTK